jgi:hypothetical protein
MQRACLGGVSVLVLALALSGGCTVGDRSGTGDGGPHAHSDTSVIFNPDCDPSVDSDHDGIADGEEDDNDIDMDGMPNDHDTDSDGDGIPDMDEHGPYGACSVLDTDHDGIPDYLDTDSDNDGLSDRTETTMTNTSPTDTDSDDDGFTDLGEIAAGTNPNDATDGIPAEDFFVILPYQGAHVMRPLDFGTTLRVADVYFVVDATGSMGAPIHNVSTSLTDIASQLAGVIDDVQFGVGYIEDFPFRHGFPIGGAFYGGPSDVAYHNSQDITADLGAVRSALDALYVPTSDPMFPGGYMAIGDGGDGNESCVEGLWQTATGAGGDWTFAFGGTYSIPRRECPASPDERSPRRGYPCFRPGSLPIIVMVNDFDWHNGGADGLHYPYMSIAPAPHGLPDVASAFNDLGARYVGVPVPTTGTVDMPTAPRTWRTDHDALAMMTGSVDASGQPLVFPADTMGHVGSQVVQAIETLALHTPMDVTTEADDWQPNPDGVDATQFVKSITAFEGYGPGPGEGYDHHDDTTFYAVVPGTTLRFDVDFWNDFRMPTDTAQVFRAKIAVIGNRSARLDERNVYIIVPPDHVEIVF